MNETGAAEGGNLFLQMVLTLQTSAMQHLGKIASPFTGKVERDLGSARAAVDMLVMLKDKTRGNLSEVESKVLERVIYELQMNYVDETGKPEPTDESEAGAPDGAGAPGEADEGREPAPAGDDGDETPEAEAGENKES